MARAAVDISQFRIEPGTELKDLGDFPTEAQIFRRKGCYESALGALGEEMWEYQNVLAADRSKALLAAFQGMDASGKDHVCRTLIKCIDPLQVAYRTFKAPTADEYKEDFMARHERALPKLGQIGFWNRSHLEEIGRVRVHPTLLENRGLKIEDVTPQFWEDRFARLRDAEAQWCSRNIQPVKIFLHISPKFQADQLAERAEKPIKRGKFDANDLIERAHWEEYSRYYAEGLAKTSTVNCPSYVVPADNRLGADVISATIINHHLKLLRPQVPTYSLVEEQKFLDYARELQSQGRGL